MSTLNIRIKQSGLNVSNDLKFPAQVAKVENLPPLCLIDNNRLKKQYKNQAKLSYSLMLGGKNDLKIII